MDYLTTTKYVLFHNRQSFVNFTLALAICCIVKLMLGSVVQLDIIEKKDTNEGQAPCSLYSLGHLRTSEDYFTCSLYL